jgi:ATP adenylyltransferase
MAAKDITLPADLAARSIEHFDDLVTKDIIKYAESTSELVEYRSGHEVQFRIVPSLSRKPLLASSAVSHTTPLPPDPNKKPFNPFLDPKPEEIVLNHIGSGHRLLTNKYCVTRPMLLLTAAEFQSQNEDLNEADIIAIWAVLRTVGRGWMAIYNCGPESGNSQRHKHMQCFPIFDGIKMPPEKLASNKKCTECLDNRPGVFG